MTQAEGTTCWSPRLFLPTSLPASSTLFSRVDFELWFHELRTEPCPVRHHFIQADMDFRSVIRAPKRNRTWTTAQRASTT